MHEEFFAMATAIGTVFKELGKMLDSAGVMPLDAYSEKFGKMALQAEAEGENHSRYLAGWAHILAEAVRNRPDEPTLN